MSLIIDLLGVLLLIVLVTLGARSLFRYLTGAEKIKINKIKEETEV